MAHSFIESFDDEAAAFEAFARARPDGLTLLLDTYDTETAARKVVALAPKLKASGIAIRSVRLDSGDLAALAKSVRNILDQGGLAEVAIFASGGLDEDSLAALIQKNAPIDGYGIGTSLTTSADVPNFDCVYKLQEYAGVARRKRSEKKATWPGRKQVWRRAGADGRIEGDILAVEGDPKPGEPLIALVMQSGKRLRPPEPLAAIRERAKRELERLPEPLRRLEPQATYPVEIAPELEELAAAVDRRMRIQTARSKEEQ
jgi:nicotinate phosphoribosyltransferase